MKNLVTVILLVCINFAYASECYHYHTPHYYDVFVKNDSIVFQHTIKDINTLSFVSQEEIILDNISTDGFRLAEQDENYILFQNSENYYIIDLNSNHIKENNASIIYKISEVIKTVGTSFFYVNNQWVYIDTNPPYQESKYIQLPKLTKNLEIVHKDKSNRRWLLKDDKNYYSLSDRKFKLIPNLNIKTTQFYETEHHLEDNFLYDENTFYLMDYNYEYTDITSNFKLYGNNDNFLKMSFHNTYNELYFKENDSLIWAYVKSGTSLNQQYDGFLWEHNKNKIDLKKMSSIHFFPLRAGFINKNHALLEINSKVYFNFFSARYREDGIDISVVKNVDSLKKLDNDTFYDGTYHYTYDYDARKLNKVSSFIDKKSVFYPGVHFYGRHLSPFYRNENLLNYYDNKHKLVKTKEIKTDINKLTLAYAYDDVLLIEDQEIPNIADRETIEFLGSTVDVISGCDGGKGQIDIEIKYYYFFKDKDAFYFYYSDNKEMKPIKNIPSDITDYTSFNGLKELENLCK